jgi:hypothetical protein
MPERVKFHLDLLQLQPDITQCLFQRGKPLRFGLDLRQVLLADRLLLEEVADLIVEDGVLLHPLRQPQLEFGDS